MAVTEVTCADEQYQPTRAQMPPIPLSLGRGILRTGGSYTPERRGSDGQLLSIPVDKMFRRIARKILKVAKDCRIDRQIAAARVVFTEKTNSHEKKRLIKKQREYERERRAEEKRLADKLRLEKKLEKAATSKPLASGASTTSPSPSPSDSTTCAPSETPSSAFPGRDE